MTPSLDPTTIGDVSMSVEAELRKALEPFELRVDGELYGLPAAILMPLEQFLRGCGIPLRHQPTVADIIKVREVLSRHPEPPTVSEVAKFEAQRYGAVVATIVDTADDALEVQARNDGKFVLTVHCRDDERDRWDDLSVVLEPRHFALLGSIANIKVFP